MMRRTNLGRGEHLSTGVFLQDSTLHPAPRFATDKAGTERGGA